jgi:hypothetical protein
MILYPPQISPAARCAGAVLSQGRAAHHATGVATLWMAVLLLRSVTELEFARELLFIAFPLRHVYLKCVFSLLRPAMAWKPDKSLQDGECKGYAFVQFPSIEYAQYFMATFGKANFVALFFFLLMVDKSCLPPLSTTTQLAPPATPRLLS